MVQFQKDSAIYARLFSEIFLYLRLNGYDLPWHAVLVFRSRSVEPSPRERIPYEPLLASSYVTRIYLNELETTETTPLSLKIIRLVLAKRRQVFEQVISNTPWVKTQG
ncbi:DUF2887 domain-containing protein [Spirulina sp. CS-785/01]|uniref:DUF2887 domain-containing protein n=1 Tax=Spirulina sp. CS-785/01 TaxID=3021716 RepID=UPI00232F4ADE|nr:DUF2887 domain-containing protein [Spirulina sp. CS-785/01]MDB9312778.1 DUF2887 domain-containing protein [Spirulina sp. CS-785/01]